MEGRPTSIGYAQTVTDVTLTSSCDESSVVTSHEHPVIGYLSNAVSLAVTWCPPVLIILGTLGNLLLIFLLIRMLWSGALSTSLYPLMSGLMDLVVLYMFCGTEWFQHFTGHGVREIAMTSSNSLCRLYPFVSDFALHFSIWLTVAMTLETALVKVSPERAERLNRLDIARAVVLFLVVIIICVNAHCFWTYGLVKGDLGSSTTKFEVCTVARPGNQQNDNFFKVFWPLTIIVFVDLVPLVIVVMCVVTIVIKCHESPPDRMIRLRTVWKSNNIDPKTSQELQSSFLVISFLFLVMMTPAAVCDISVFLTTTTSSSSSSTTSSSSSSYLLAESVGHESSVMTRKDMSSAVSRALIYVLCSVPKVIAFFVRCPSFRRELVDSLTSCWHCQSSWQHHRLDTSDRGESTKTQAASVYPLDSINAEVEKLKASHLDASSKVLIKVDND